MALSLKIVCLRLPGSVSMKRAAVVREPSLFSAWPVPSLFSEAASPLIKT